MSARFSDKALRTDAASACFGKEPFASRVLAAEHLDRIRARKRRQHKTDEGVIMLRVYKCPHCPQFHIGKQR